MAVSYQRDIKPLFTQMDRDHMLNSFDLWNYDDVKTNAEPIYAAVEGGTMPPPGTEPRWSADRVQAFRQWMRDGYLP
jgi:hypothetical protein